MTSIWTSGKIKNVTNVFMSAFTYYNTINVTEKGAVDWKVICQSFLSVSDMNIEME